MRLLTLVIGVVAFSNRGALAGFVIEDSSRSTDKSNNLSMATGVASQGRRQLTGYVMTDSNIRSARDAWVSNSAAAEATYGHISTWDTSGVTDMSYLFCGEDSPVAVFMGCNKKARWFNDDISAWETYSVTMMFRMFYYALYFDQDLGWCVHNGALSSNQHVFDDSQCESTNCGVYQRKGGCAPTPMPTSAVPTATPAPTVTPTTPGPSPAPSRAPTTTPAPTVTPLVADDTTIRTAVAAWLSNPTAAEATYGHISTWGTGGVTDMSYLFCSYGYSHCNTTAASFNEDISAWDTSGVTTMNVMFWGASAFDQNLGWCIGDHVSMSLRTAFSGTRCASTFCGVAWASTAGCGGSGYVVDDDSIRGAVRGWLEDRSGAEAE